MKAISLAISLMALNVMALPAGLAHNLDKYTNVPFAVAASCPQYDNLDGGSYSAQFTTVKGTQTLKVVTDFFGWAGFEVFCSVPTTGTLPNSSSQSFPEGTLTFNYSSTAPMNFTSDPNSAAYAYYTDNPTSTVQLHPVITANTVTIPINNPGTPGANVISVGFAPGVGTVGSGSATMYFSNFRYNNAPLLIDLTVTDQSSAGINFCTLE